MNNPLEGVFVTILIVYMVACALLVPMHLIGAYLEARDCRVGHGVDVCIYVMQPQEDGEER